MAKIFTDGKDQIAGGVVYRPDKSGYVDIHDKVVHDEGLADKVVQDDGLADDKNIAKPKPKPKQPETIKFLNQEG